MFTSTSYAMPEAMGLVWWTGSVGFELGLVNGTRRITVKSLCTKVGAVAEDPEPCVHVVAGLGVATGHREVVDDGGAVLVGVVDPSRQLAGEPAGEASRMRLDLLPPPGLGVVQPDAIPAPAPLTDAQRQAVECPAVQPAT